MSEEQLPVAVIGAGPVGLAAATHLISRGETPLVLEVGLEVGAAIRRWGHVRLFSPWRFNVDATAARLLEETGWRAPEPETYPTGNDLIERYLLPLARLPQLAPHIQLGTRVLAVARAGFDKMKTPGREAAPFVLRVERDGVEEDIVARAVIDASGTYLSPNPLGANGLPAIGEAALAEHIFYGIPDVLGAHRQRFANRSVLVVGSGHSAFNTLLDLAELAKDAPQTKLYWTIRRADIASLYGGGAADVLPERGSLGQRLEELVTSSRVRLVTNFPIRQLTKTEQGILVTSQSGEALPPIDAIVATTGFRPDLTPLRELRLSIDPSVESPAALAPLIDPNVHSCGTVPPHGAHELAHPEADFYMVGMKSYGRAPTFLLLTGYEQVRSVVAALTGDWDAARQVQLVLPETGVCSVSNAPAAAEPEPASCCAPTCCVTAEVPLTLTRR